GERRSGGVFTDRRYTGQREEAGLGLYDYNARYYDPYLNRFIQADSIVPAAARSAGGSAATLGYDSSTRLTPLTVNLGEFAAQVNAENREVLQFGAFFQWNSKTRQEHNVPMGPASPQALNRYAYCLNNPLRYVDPTGHFLDGLGFRIDFSAAQIIGLDGNIDFVYNFKTKEAGIYFTLNGIGVGEGFGLTAGPLLFFNLDDNSDLEGWQVELEATLKDTFGLEASISTDLLNPGEPVIVFFGGGVGAEIQGNLGIGKCWDITDQVMALATKLAELAKQSQQ
ncbi:MAG: RHS repeat-associated core domain-containing protein, partial [Anaerolineae bacterium]